MLHLRPALRSLRKHQGITFINVVGLAVGLACCLLIARYVLHERSYDRFHAHGERVYRLSPDVTMPSGTQSWTATQGPLAPALMEVFPEVETAVRLYNGEAVIQHDAVRHVEENLQYADAAFLDVFSFPLLQGDAATALQAPSSIVLTASMARKYFGTESVLGETLVLDGTRTHTITGVLADLPSNTRFDFDVLLPIETLKETGPEWLFESWGDFFFTTYVQLAEGQRPQDFIAKLDRFIDENVPFLREGMSPSYVLEAVPDLYLYSDRGADSGAQRRASLYLFAIVALFILGIACINFMNLATARSAERATEVGVRKTVGAGRGSLVAQFLTESMLVAILAGVLAVGLASLAYPAFVALTGKAMPTSIFAEPLLLGLLAAAVLVVGLAAGSYPALVLSGFRPAAVLKGAFRHSAQGVWLRKGLVVLQFGISVVLIVGTGVVYSQLSYLNNQDLGFDKEQLLVLEFDAAQLTGAEADAEPPIETIKESLAQQTSVEGVSASRAVPGTRTVSALTTLQTADRSDWQNTLTTYLVDDDFLATYELDLAAGRFFTPQFASDAEEAIIINETMARTLGFTQPQDALGTTFQQWGNEGTVVGVVQDFNFASLHAPILPMSMRLASAAQTQYLTLRVATNDLPNTLSDIRASWETLVPQYPFTYRFLDESFDEAYRAEQQFGRLFGTFAALAILIACLGLFGLAAYAIQQRIKEIGVRKVLGASVPSLIGLLSKDFLQLIGVAFVIAAPLAYFGAQRWLDGFAYHTDPSLVLFALSGVLVAAIALVTVSYEALRVASINPTECLRSE